MKKKNQRSAALGWVVWRWMRPGVTSGSKTHIWLRGQTFALAGGSLKIKACLRALKKEFKKSGLPGGKGWGVKGLPQNPHPLAIFDFAETRLKEGPLGALKKELDAKSDWARQIISACAKSLGLRLRLGGLGDPPMRPGAGAPGVWWEKELNDWARKNEGLARALLEEMALEKCVGVISKKRAKKQTRL